MSAPRPALNQVLGGIVQVTNTGLFRSAVKHWWLTAPLGFAAYSVLRQRYKKGELNFPNAINDLAPMVTVVATLIILNNALEQRELQRAPTAPSPQPLGPVTDASFTPVPRQAEPVPAIPVSGEYQ